MSDPIFDFLRKSLRGEVRRDEPLCRHSTWRVGGPADLFVVPADRQDLLSALSLLQQVQLPWFPLGAGSNLLVGDAGFRGTAVYTGRLRQLQFDPDGWVTAGGGLPMMTLLTAAARRGLRGLESLAGIPGTVGGAVLMNAGAGGQQIADVLQQAVLTGPAGEELWEAERLEFGYRRSAVPAHRVVAEARLRLSAADPEGLKEEIRRRLAHRRSSHPRGLPNAGSVFKNPPGGAAWRLITAAGLRGAEIGGARVSEQHANFIVNTGSATAGDILALIERIREEVFRTAGIELELEVKIIGEA